LGVVVGIENAVGVGEDGHGLSVGEGTLTGSITPVLSLS
jgi:hypothetical protein